MPTQVQAADQATLKGRWEPAFDMPNVAIHTHVLPNGKVLFWGRRDKPTLTLNEHSCTPFVWDPATGKSTPTPQPTLQDGHTTVNLFCSGHTFLPDGRLLVVGGHRFDGIGANQAALYDWNTNTWAATEPMNNGRWYPTAVTLADGSALAISGSFGPDAGPATTNDISQVWNNGAWSPRVNFIGLPLYPRMHVAPDGRLFMTGSLALTQFLDTANPPGVGTWTPLGTRAAGARDYAPSVMYDVGKILYIGGGNDPKTQKPTNLCEIIDLTAHAPAWKPTGSMHFPRRQHNATLLPDGTVLVTGGTQGGGGPNPGFNDLTPGAPIHAAEIWDPSTGQWTLLAEEQFDRCYHSTAVLLPDATVLSAGGGEYFPIESTGKENDPKDSHRNGQIFSPPYLFRGPRPKISASPAEAVYGQTFDVETPNAAEIDQVSWVRLSSVTHSFDQNQRLCFLKFARGAGKLTVTAPPNANVCPPGHYMMFVLNAAKVPSVAKIIRVHAAVAAPVKESRPIALTSSVQIRSMADTLREVDAANKGTHVLVGLTSTCPYGISACWGGAYEGLAHLDGAKWVRPIPNAEDSTASVYLKDAGLPDVENWPQQFSSSANGSYVFRGVEVSLDGEVDAKDGGLILQADEARPAVVLTPIRPEDKIQWDQKAHQLRPLTHEEQTAYQRLKEWVEGSPGQAHAVHVAGPLKKTDAGYELSVRTFRS